MKINSVTVEGVDTFEVADFKLKDGVLSVKEEGAQKITDNNEKTLTVKVSYQKKADARAEYTLSKTSDTLNFKIQKQDEITPTSKVELNAIKIAGKKSVRTEYLW